MSLFGPDKELHCRVGTDSWIAARDWMIEEISENGKKDTEGRKTIEGWRWEFFEGATVDMKHSR